MLRDLEGRDWRDKARDIIVLGSVVGRHVSPFSSMYGSTKFAVHSLAEALRREIGPRGVRVTLIEPAVVVSEFQSVAGYTDDLVAGFEQKFGPLLAPEDIARAIAFIARNRPRCMSATSDPRDATGLPVMTTRAGLPWLRRSGLTSSRC